MHPQFVSDVMKPLRMDELLDQVGFHQDIVCRRRQRSSVKILPPLENKRGYGSSPSLLMSFMFVCIPDMQVAAGIYARWKSAFPCQCSMQSCYQQGLIGHALIEGKECPCRLRQLLYQRGHSSCAAGRQQHWHYAGAAAAEKWLDSLLLSCRRCRTCRVESCSAWPSRCVLGSPQTFTSLMSPQPTLTQSSVSLQPRYVTDQNIGHFRRDAPNIWESACGA